jgi:acetyltransferase-like isoleucine patch superfamily enzyme
MEREDRGTDWVRRDELQRQEHPWGTLFVTEAAAKKLPRFNQSRPQAIRNEVVLMCPVEGTITLHGVENTVHIGGDPTKTSRISLNFWGKKNVFSFGPQSTSNGMVAELIEGDRLTIGRDCMLAGEIVFRPNDMHAILDAEGRIINKSAPIVIGDHVWIGQRSIILKGVTIGSGSVIGSVAVVTKSAPPATAIGGNPARPLRRNVAWTRRFSPDPGEVAAALAYVSATETA